MKKIIVFVLFYSFIQIGHSQNLDLYKKAKEFPVELNAFIKKTNQRNVAKSRYLVYVIYAYPLIDENTVTEGVGYTVGYIFNHDGLNYINPQYYFTDSLNLIVVTFNPQIKDKSIPGLKLNKLMDKIIIKNKLKPESGGYITGVFETFIYNDYPKRKETVFYKNSDRVPREKSIYNYFPPVEIRKISEGNTQDRLNDKCNP